MAVAAAREQQPTRVKSDFLGAKQTLVVARITDRVYLVDTLAIGSAGTVAVYVIKGPKPTLIDTGYASSYMNVLQSLVELGVQPSDVRYVIPTHVHLDHAGGAGHLLKHMPNAQVIAQERSIPHLADPSRLIESATSVFGKELIEKYGIPAPIPNERMMAVGEEMQLDLGGISLTALHTPGHAPHQISLVADQPKLLFSADAVGIVYPSVPVLIPTTPPPSFDPVKHEDSLQKLLQLDSSQLLVPHYGVRDDVRTVIGMTRDRTNSWLSRVSTWKAKGLGLEEIVTELESEVKRETGLADKDLLPQYAALSIKVSVMGMLHFLERSGSSNH